MNLYKKHHKYLTINKIEYSENQKAKKIFDLFDKYDNIIKSFSEAGFEVVDLATQCYMSGSKEVGESTAFLTIYQGMEGTTPYLQFAFSLQGSTIEKLYGKYSIDYSADVTESITKQDILKLLSGTPENREDPKFDTSNVFSVKPIIKKFY